MSFEYFVNKDEKPKKLNKQQEDEIVQKVCSDFVSYDDARKENLEQAGKLENKIFFRSKNNDSEKKEDSWKTKIDMCKAYMFYCTLLAFIWKNVYQSVNSMFDVSGEDEESDNDSNKEKAMLVDIFEKMEFSKTFDKAVRNFMTTGELIFFCGWHKEYEEFRRPVSLNQDVSKTPQMAAALLKGQNFYTDIKKIYDNPKVYAINSSDFVYDVSQEENFDKAPKIYRSWKTPSEIINNKFYHIDEETKKELKELIQSPLINDLTAQSDSDLRDKVTNCGTVEVLEHWGDFRMKNGTILENWHIVVVARKFLVKFEKNFRLINPFTFGGFLQDPKTKRHISLLYCILSLSETQEQMMNKTCNLQALEENPPVYAPKGLFTEPEKLIYPGKIIEFGDGLNPEQIKEMQFTTNVYSNTISYLSDLMAEISGIFPNMVGQNETGDKTATEISTKTEGQMTRLSMIVDFINQYGVIPVVKKVAKLKSDFTFGTETIFTNKNNQKEVIEVDDTVRQGDYKFTYSDRIAMSEKSNKADMVVNAAKEFAQFIPLNAQELFTWYMEQKGVENPERFLQQMQLMPVEIQQMLLQDPRMQEIVNNFEAQKQNGGMPNQQEVKTVDDTNIPQGA